MKFQKFQVQILQQTDVTKDAWLISKPTAQYESEEELDEVIEGMVTQDLPLSAFKHFDLAIKSSLLFRDLLFTIRPCIAWCSSFRVNPITEEYIEIEDSIGMYDDLDKAFIDSNMQKVYKWYEDGQSNDVLKQWLYLGTMCQYTISIDSRTLMCLIATLHDLDAGAFSYHIQRLCEVLGFEGFEDLPKASANSLFEKLRVNDEFNYSELEPNYDFNISEFTSNEALQVGILNVVVDASTGGQFLRQHFSLMRNQMFDIVKKYGYKYTCMYTCKDRFRYISFGPIQNFHKLCSKRICWAAHFDHSYERSKQISWADIVDPIIGKLDVHEFAKLLPCRLAYQNCEIVEEMKTRLDHNIDKNPPCPIFTGDPSWIEKRVEYIKSDSRIMDYWLKMKENGLIKERDTKYKVKENE